MKIMTVVEANARAAAGSLTLVDVRPPEERALAAVNVPFSVFDGDARSHLESLAKDTPLAFLCHHGGRSAQAAEHFRNLGFRDVYNVEGGIEAWALQADTHVPRY
jgi:monothiol glutaredoxin